VLNFDFIGIKTIKIGFGQHLKNFTGLKSYFVHKKGLNGAMEHCINKIRTTFENYLFERRNCKRRIIHGLYSIIGSKTPFWGLFHSHKPL